MAVPVTINPNNSGTISFAGTEYGDQIINWVVEPSANTSETPGSFGAPPQTRNTQSQFALSFDYLQDWGAVGSLSQYLNDNDGELVAFEFTPTDTNIPKCSGNCWVHAGAFGGPAGEDWQHSGQFPIEGKPTYTPQP